MRKSMICKIVVCGKHTLARLAHSEVNVSLDFSKEEPVTL